MSTKEKKSKSSKTDDRRSQKKLEEITIVVDQSAADLEAEKVDNVQENFREDPERHSPSHPADAEINDSGEEEKPRKGVLADVNKLTEILVERLV